MKRRKCLTEGRRDSPMWYLISMPSVESLIHEVIFTGVGVYVCMFVNDRRRLS